ncbi:hypothetical protein PSPO01_16145 [Paraphaeosphaeria sporulosa]
MNEPNITFEVTVNDTDVASGFMNEPDITFELPVNDTNVTSGLITGLNMTSKFCNITLDNPSISQGFEDAEEQIANKPGADEPDFRKTLHKRRYCNNGSGLWFCLARFGFLPLIPLLASSVFLIAYPMERRFPQFKGDEFERAELGDWKNNVSYPRKRTASLVAAFLALPIAVFAGYVSFKKEYFMLAMLYETAIGYFIFAAVAPNIDYHVDLPHKFRLDERSEAQIGVDILLGTTKAVLP